MFGKMGPRLCESAWPSTDLICTVVVLLIQIRVEQCDEDLLQLGGLFRAKGLRGAWGVDAEIPQGLKRYRFWLEGGSQVARMLQAT